MAIIDNPTVTISGGSVTEETALQYMLENKTNYSGIAAGLTTLTELPTFTQPSGITIYSNMFDGCSALPTSALTGLSTTGGADFRYMFRNCTSLTSIPTIDYSSVLNAGYMFYGCNNMVGDVSINRSGSCGGEQMFYGCSKITSVTASSTLFSSISTMFSGCTNLSSVNIGLVSPVAPLGATGMFNTCSKLATVVFNVSTNIKISTAVNMFLDCSKLTSVTFSSSSRYLDCSYCTSLGSMFSGCSKLTTIFTIKNTKNVTSFSSTFKNCSLLANIPQLDMSSATSLGSYVTGCSSLSNTSLNNILGSLITATSYTGTKTLKYIGLTSAQATTCTGLSNWAALSAAGWTKGY